MRASQSQSQLVAAAPAAAQRSRLLASESFLLLSSPRMRDEATRPAARLLQGTSKTRASTQLHRVSRFEAVLVLVQHKWRWATHCVSSGDALRSTRSRLSPFLVSARCLRSLSPLIVSFSGSLIVFIDWSLVVVLVVLVVLVLVVLVVLGLFQAQVAHFVTLIVEPV